jgi:hypothetical protein
MVLESLTRKKESRKDEILNGHRSDTQAKRKKEKQNWEARKRLYNKLCINL